MPFENHVVHYNLNKIYYFNRLMILIFLTNNILFKTVSSYLTSRLPIQLLFNKSITKLNTINNRSKR